jgi:predicted dehydrogenase
VSTLEGVPTAAPAGARVVGVVMNGVTGRMGLRQHLVRSILAIRGDGGMRVGEETVWPEPILVGRNEDKLRAIAAEHGLGRWTTDPDRALAEPDAEIYFDSGLTSMRTPSLARAIEAGKHVYCEKPLADDLASAIEIARMAERAGVKHGIVEDKLYLPGIRKLARLLDEGALGDVLSIRGEFGYWIFDGLDGAPLQRPSWNYRAEDGGGIVVDMFPHWHYVLDGLFGSVRWISCEIATHVGERADENGVPYPVTADDSAYGILGLEGGMIAQMNSSWCVRVNRDELLELQVDGTGGSAVAGLHRCRVQLASETPTLRWDPDVPSAEPYREQWSELETRQDHAVNAFRAQWEQFLAHVVGDRPISFDLFHGAAGVQLAGAALESAREHRRIALEPLAR